MRFMPSLGGRRILCNSCRQMHRVHGRLRGYRLNEAFGCPLAGEVRDPLRFVIPADAAARGARPNAMGDCGTRRARGIGVGDRLGHMAVGGAPATRRGGSPGIRRGMLVGGIAGTFGAARRGRRRTEYAVPRGPVPVGLLGAACRQATRDLRLARRVWRHRRAR